MHRIRPVQILVLLAGLGGLLLPGHGGGIALPVTPALAATASQPAAEGHRSVQLPGRVTEALNVRSEPRVADDTRLRTLQPNDPVWVFEAVTATDGELWYRVGDDEYTHAAEVRLPRTPPRH